MERCTDEKAKHKKQKESNSDHKHRFDTDYSCCAIFSAGSLKRQNWVVGTNGSYFYYSGGEPALAGVFIKDGQHISGAQTTGNEMCLKSDGTLFTAAAGTSAADLLNQGVIQTWGDGALSADHKRRGTGQGAGYNDKRQRYVAGLQCNLSENRLWHGKTL